MHAIIGNQSSLGITFPVKLTSSASLVNFASTSFGMEVHSSVLVMQHSTDS